MINLNNKSILAIDDAAAIRTFLRISLQAQGANFYEAANADDGLKLAGRLKPDLIVLDLGLPDRDGLDILPSLKEPDSDGKSPAVIILSVRKEQQTKDRARELGADGYLSKPFLMDDLLDIIQAKVTPAELS
ncbi:MAG: response regulator [Bdellovibrionales bacterium]